MSTIAGFPYAEVEFTKDGTVHDQAQVDAVHSMLADSRVSDLVVISHGWNNDMREAHELYEKFFASFRALVDDAAVPATAGRRYGVLAVLWPSKRFADRELIASGAASVGGLGDRELLAEVDHLAEALDDSATEAPLAEAKQLVPRLENEPAARSRFADLVRSVLSAEAADREDASSELFTVPGEQLMEELAKRPPAARPPGPAGGGGAAVVGTMPPPPPAAGEAAGLREFVTGAKAAARRLVNYATYYEMKNRAGVVGRGVNAVLRDVRGRRRDVKLHLVGHSFGGRLVTAAASAGGIDPATVTLLQAAFSHYGFAENWDDKAADGLFRPMITEGMVSGPVLITCTRNDTAVGRAYPIASQIMRQNASWTGGPTDPYGGIGSNGAQKTPEASDGRLLPVGSSYTFQPGRLHNLTADDFIADHSDVCGREVAYAVLTAIGGS
jgi:hypothetical protein